MPINSGSLRSILVAVGPVGSMGLVMVVPDFFKLDSVGVFSGMDLWCGDISRPTSTGSGGGTFPGLVFWSFLSPGFRSVSIGPGVFPGGP